MPSLIHKCMGVTVALMMIGLSTVTTAQAVTYAETLTLAKAYELALVRSETIAINAEFIKETEGRFYQALSTALPEVNWDYSNKWQDRSNDGSARRKTPQSQFTFSQSLFSGFKEFAAISASKAERRQYEAQLERAKHLLFVDVADAFYFLRGYQEELEVLQAINTALGDRSAELNRRQALGRSRTSEVASIDARVYQNQAEIENLKAEAQMAVQLLEFLVGQPVLAVDAADRNIETLSDLNDYAARVETRPDVKAAKEAVTVSKKGVTVAQSGYWPTVDLDGNAYTKRVGAMAGSDWDVTLSVSVPLFSGGLDYGNVTQAKAIARQDELRLSQVKRQALLDIQNKYTRLIADQKRTAAYAKAVEATQKNYDLQSGDYQNNLVNNLDVLQSLEDLQDMKRSYVTLKNDTQRAYWAFRVAIGDIKNDAI